jgi:DNA (cytosine-5)-methyltransferase 1
MEQLSIFDFITEDKSLPTDIKLLSLFSGIGAFEKALDRLGINYELVNYCEIDKHASRSYSAIHNVSEELNLWDVTKVDEKALPKDIDLLTYGFPCQDISLAGKQKGLFNEDGTKTRSGLFFDALRIIEETQPKVAIAENVKNLVGKKFSEQFKIVLDSLESAGYNNYYQVLNAKDYGIPQNRERVFIISIRKDIDNGMFEFPKGFPLEKRLKDVLEDTVDEKHYLSDKMIDYISQKGTKNFSNANCKINCTIARPLTTDQNKRAGTTNYLCENLPENFDINRIKVVGRINSSQDGVVVSTDGIAPTHTAGHGNTPKIIEEPTIHQVGQIYPNSGNPQAGRIYDADGISPTMDTCSGGNRNQQIRADQSCVGTLTQNCGADLKRNGQGIIEKHYVSEKGVKFILSPKRGMCTDVNADVAQPLTAKGQQNWTGSFVSPDIESLEKSTTIGSTEPVKINLKNGETITSNDDTSYLRIRKLTPKECFRLMGFDDSDFHKAEKVNSSTQLYKQAGNSIVVDVLEHLLAKALKAI